MDCAHRSVRLVAFGDNWVETRMRYAHLRLSALVDSIQRVYFCHHKMMEPSAEYRWG